MCDHCANITSQKEYAGQVTCRCNGEKKNSVVSKEKDFSGCCSKRGKEKRGGSCGAKCCAGTKERGGCCSDPATDPKSCCPADKKSTNGPA
ncbi:hypothetical protein PUN28_011775 [Cardiocondyla obscurior]|uniref:Uncharacterized protein n=1 Tax=Cardiocondyla obscurior TaxID=286306 RepID=A0AAW2FKN1_9HYME